MRLKLPHQIKKTELINLMKENPSDKVEKILSIFRDCNIDDWAKALKQQYLDKAYHHLNEIAVVSTRKKPLLELAEFLVAREH